MSQAPLDCAGMEEYSALYQLSCPLEAAFLHPWHGLLLHTSIPCVSIVVVSPCGAGTACPGVARVSAA